MIILTNPGILPETLDHVLAHVESAGVRTHVVHQQEHVAIVCLDAGSSIDVNYLRTIEGVRDIQRIETPYKLASRQLAPLQMGVRMDDAAHTVVGSRDIVVMAGPCSVEGKIETHLL